jgi:hypothetical protein
MSADTTSIFYQIGQATKTNVTNAITALKAANNTWTGTNDFKEDVTVGASGATKGFKVFGTAETTSDLTVGGNLTVSGTTTTVSTSNTTLQDNFLVLNKGAKDSSSDAPDAGLLFERKSGVDNATILFEEANDRFEFGTTSATGAGANVDTVSLGKIAVNDVLIGTRSSTQPLGDLADFNAGLSSSSGASGGGSSEPEEVYFPSYGSTHPWNGTKSQYDALSLLPDVASINHGDIIKVKKEFTESSHTFQVGEYYVALNAPSSQRATNVQVNVSHIDDDGGDIILPRSRRAEYIEIILVRGTYDGTTWVGQTPTSWS